MKWWQILLIALALIGIALITAIYLWPSPRLATLGTTSRELPADISGETLVDHFERVTTLVLTTIGAIAALLGIFGAIGGYFSFRTLRELQNMVSETKDTISAFERRQEDLENRIEDANTRMSRLRCRMLVDTELGDKIPSVRIRALQQIGASADITFASTLIKVLAKDDSEDVRREAAHWLGVLLARGGGGEADVAAQGIEALTKGTKDKSEKVVLWSIKALDAVVCEGHNIDLPCYCIDRLHKLVKSRKNSVEIKKAATETLEHVKEKRADKATP